MTHQATVVYVGEPDVVHVVSQGCPGLVFGRDPDSCDVVVWSALTEPTLSRRAGQIRLLDGQLWLRNLSTTHDLVVAVPGRPPESPLPPRTGADDPGAARTLPAQPCLVLGPAGCELVVRPPSASADVPDVAAGADLLDDEDELVSTASLPPVPAHLDELAEVLCAPLMRGGALPATYTQLCDELGIESLKRVRSLVAELCGLYAPSVHNPQHARARRVREERLVSALLGRPAHRSTDGWRFDLPDRPVVPQERQEQGPQRRGPALPDYHDVAHLLVRHGLVGTPEQARAERERAEQFWPVSRRAAGIPSG